MLSHLLLCWQVPKSGPALPRSDATAVINDPQGGKRQQAYKTEIVGGVVVHTPIQVIKRKLWCSNTACSLSFALKTTLCVMWNIWTWWLHDCYSDNEDGYDKMFQNENEESEGRERKGNRPGVLRCSYCVKQGNVVSTPLLITD